MNTIPRRLFSSSSKIRSTAPTTETSNALPPFDLSTPVSAKHLPRVIQRQISRTIYKLEVKKAGEGSSLPSKISIQNPFLVSRSNKKMLEDGEIRYSWRKPFISNRRQKQLLTYYPSMDLPFSPKSLKSSSIPPVSAVSRPVKWNNDITIHWKSELNQKQQSKLVDETVSSGGQDKSIYTGRKQMFKGHKDERNRSQKLADRQVRLDGMEKRIKDWRQGRNDEKLRNRPSLPF